MFDEADVLSDLDQLRSRYEILRRLGVDGSAPVYAARVRATGRHFAVKVMTDRASRAKSPGALHGWQAHNIEPLRHPNLMTMHAVHHLQGGAVAVAMERRRGRTLAERLRDGRPELAEVEAILRNVGEALAYLHGRGVVHRGVRPESIFLDRDAGCARLAHFGLETEHLIGPGAEKGSWVLRDPEGVGAAGLALRYLAPEQLKDGIAVDGPRISPATDLFSLGVTGWELLTGHHPFDAARGDGDGGDGWRKRLVGRLAEACPEAPAELVAAIDACLDANPGRRLANGADFVARLGAPDREAARLSHPETQLRDSDAYGPDLEGSGRDAKGSERRSDDGRESARQPPVQQLRGSRRLPEPGTSPVGRARGAIAGRGRFEFDFPIWGGGRTAGEEATRRDGDGPRVGSGGGSRRASLTDMVLPAISFVAVASVIVGLHLRSTATTEGRGAGDPVPSAYAEPGNMQLLEVGGSPGGDGDLEILDSPGSTSYRVHLRPLAAPSTAEPPAESTRVQTAQPSSGAVPEAQAESLPALPVSPLRDTRGSSAGFVLLGEPVRR